MPLGMPFSMLLLHNSCVKPRGEFIKAQHHMRASLVERLIAPNPSRPRSLSQLQSNQTRLQNTLGTDQTLNHIISNRPIHPKDHQRLVTLDISFSVLFILM